MWENSLRTRLSPTFLTQKLMALGKIKVLIFGSFLKNVCLFSGAILKKMSIFGSIKITGCVNFFCISYSSQVLLHNKLWFSELFYLLIVFWTSLDNHPTKSDIIGLSWVLGVPYRDIRKFLFTKFSYNFFIFISNHPFLLLCCIANRAQLHFASVFDNWAQEFNTFQMVLKTPFKLHVASNVEICLKKNTKQKYSIFS